MLSYNTVRELFINVVYGQDAWNHNRIYLTPPIMGGTDEPTIPYRPHLITNGEAHKTVRELAIKCKCQGAAGCVTCKCYKADMRCKMLCACNCTNRISYDN